MTRAHQPGQAASRSTGPWASNIRTRQMIRATRA